MTRLLLCLLAVLLTLGGTGLHVHATLRRARQQAHLSLKRWREQKARLRKTAIASLALKRDVRHARLTADTLEEDCQRLEAEIRRHEHPENRLYVLEERRTATDTAWTAEVRWLPPPEGGEHMPPPWQRRRFMAWAPDESAAHARIARRFPSVAGYSVSGVEARTPQAPAASPAP